MTLIIRIADAAALGDYSPSGRAEEIRRAGEREALTDEQHIAAADRNAWIVDDDMVRDIVTSSRDTLRCVSITDSQAAEIRARRLNRPDEHEERFCAACETEYHGA